MIRLSTNVLTAAADMLMQISEGILLSIQDLIFLHLSQIDTEDVFALACDCGWAKVDSNECPAVTTRGECIVSLAGKKKYQEYLQEMLNDYISTARPAWASRILYGRKEATIIMSKDERACFVEAGLLDDPAEEFVVEWWDRIAAKMRVQKNDSQLQTGRIGEKLTIQYEEKRTGVRPQWASIDTNLAGYDIKSRMSETDASELLIEVKCSTCPMEQADFHLTSYEWTVAKTKQNYILYIWNIVAGEKRLAIVPAAKLQELIPQNNYPGEWESVRVPFSYFSDDFVSVQ